MKTRKSLIQFVVAVICVIARYRCTVDATNARAFVIISRFMRTCLFVHTLTSTTERPWLISLQGLGEKGRVGATPLSISRSSALFRHFLCSSVEPLDNTPPQILCDTLSNAACVFTKSLKYAIRTFWLCLRRLDERRKQRFNECFNYTAIRSVRETAAK